MHPPHCPHIPLAQTARQREAAFAEALRKGARGTTEDSPFQELKLLFQGDCPNFPTADKVIRYLLETDQASITMSACNSIIFALEAHRQRLFSQGEAPPEVLALGHCSSIAQDRGIKDFQDAISRRQESQQAKKGYTPLVSEE